MPTIPANIYALTGNRHRNGLKHLDFNRFSWYNRVAGGDDYGRKENGDPSKKPRAGYLNPAHLEQRFVVPRPVPSLPIFQHP